jgi:hypothetical protein
VKFSRGVAVVEMKQLAPRVLWRAHAVAVGAMTDAIASFAHPT